MPCVWLAVIKLTLYLWRLPFLFTVFISDWILHSDVVISVYDQWSGHFVRRLEIFSVYFVYNSFISLPTFKCLFRAHSNNYRYIHSKIYAVLFFIYNNACGYYLHFWLNCIQNQYKICFTKFEMSCLRFVFQPHFWHYVYIRNHYTIIKYYLYYYYVKHNKTQYFV